MARPPGIEHFCQHLHGLEKYYVLIGGSAASILMDDEKMFFRSTKDVDLVILSRSEKLNKRIAEYIKIGKYQIKEGTNGKPRYYRFQKPENPLSPKLIELFARNEAGFEIEEKQHIIPISSNYPDQLSAILLSDENFELIQRNIVLSASGVPLISPVANICLKACAYKDLQTRRNESPLTVDEHDVQKHLKDICRLTVLLTGNEKVALSKSQESDLTFAIKAIENIPNAQFKQIMENTPNVTKEQVLNTLKQIYSDST